MEYSVGEHVRDAAVALFYAPMQPYITVPRCYGKTLSACMETGLGASGYDCSGLVISAISAVYGVQPTTWSRDYRHAVQMATLVDRKGSEWDWTRQNARLGDCLVFRRVIGAQERPSHMGIITRMPDARGGMILTHAARPTKYFCGEVIPQLVEPKWFDENRVQGVISLEGLVRHGLAHA